MRSLLILVILIGMNPSGMAQSFLTDFPPLFNYSLRTDSAATLMRGEEALELQWIDPNISVGCYDEPLEVALDFSLVLNHPFLYDIYPKFLEEDEDEPYYGGFQLILYGAKKQGGQWDSIFKARINDYCIYGQQNYLIEIQDYFLFTYQYAMNGGGGIKYLEQLGLWNPVVQALDQALAGKKLTKGHYPALDAETPRARDFDFEGKYLMITRDRLSDSLSIQEVLNLAVSRENSPRRLDLKSRHRAQSISNYNQPRSNWFKDKARWWRYRNFIFVWVEGWGLHAYEILDEGLLLQLDHHYAFRWVE